MSNPPSDGPELSETDLWKTALHEAAHASVGRLRMRVFPLAMKFKPIPGANGGVDYREELNQVRTSTNGHVVILSPDGVGPAADMLFAGLEGARLTKGEDYSEGADEDYQEARQILFELAKLTHEMYDEAEILDSVRAAVHCLEPTIREIASALVERGIAGLLSRDELEAGWGSQIIASGCDDAGSESHDRKRNSQGS